MPKERIPTATPNDWLTAVVGWTKALEVQVGLEMTPPASEDQPSNLLERLYGPNAGARTMVAERLRRDLDYAGPGFEEAFQDDDVLFGAIVKAMEADYIFGAHTSLWWTADRWQVNALIRLLRKARDAAFGRDE